MTPPKAVTFKNGTFRIQGTTHITCSINNTFDCNVVADKKLGPYPLGTVQGSLGTYNGVLLDKKESGHIGLDAYYVKMSGESMDVMLWMRHQCSKDGEGFLACNRY